MFLCKDGWQASCAGSRPGDEGPWTGSRRDWGFPADACCRCLSRSSFFEKRVARREATLQEDKAVGGGGRSAVLLRVRVCQALLGWLHGLGLRGDARARQQAVCHASECLTFLLHGSSVGHGGLAES